MNNSAHPKLLRWIELVLVVSLAFLAIIFDSNYMYFAKSRHSTDTELASQTNKVWQDAGARGQIGAIIHATTAIAILAYILYRQNRKFKDIGLSGSWRDIPTSIALWLIVYISGLLIYIIQYAPGYGLGNLVHYIFNSYPIPIKLTLWYSLYMVINPFFEEIIVRAFLITEIEYLTKRKDIAVLCSVGIQTLYHTYQGIHYAGYQMILSTIFSLYFVKWRRITPVIFAHMYFDLQLIERLRHLLNFI